MALFDKLKGAVKDVSKTAAAMVKSAANDLSKMGNSPEAQAKREEAKQAEYARIREEMAAEKQAKKELMERIANGDPENERWEFLESATDAEIAELDAMEAEVNLRELQKRKQARAESGYAKKLLEEYACDQVPDTGWYCTSCNNRFHANCGGMLCERKLKFENDGTFEELMFPDSVEYMARISALEEGGPAAKNDSFEDVCEEFFEEYLPALKTLPNKVLILTNIGKTNFLLEFLMRLNRVPAKMTAEHWVAFYAALGAPPKDAAAAELYYEKMFALLDNPSLYATNEISSTWDDSTEEYSFDIDIFKDFRYRLKVFSCIYNPEVLPEYFAYTSVVDPAELFTEDGAIKPTGIVAQDVSDYDTIYGVLEYWKAKSEKLAARNG